MNALFVAWQDPSSRSWAPVARLTRDQDQRYHLAYTQGARRLANFQPFGRMRDLDREYVSDELFPLFANRVLAKSRPEYQDYLGWLGLEQARYDVLEELARTGGLRATDQLELIPCPCPTENRRYQVSFFTRGLRHMTDTSQTRVQALQPDERLYLIRDEQNAWDSSALLLRTEDPIAVVGYVPRYYSAEFSRLMSLVGQAEVSVQVTKVNVDAPLQYRLLCHLSAPWPSEFQPCTGEEFQPLAGRLPTPSN